MWKIQMGTMNKFEENKNKGTRATKSLTTSKFGNFSNLKLFTLYTLNASLYDFSTNTLLTCALTCSLLNVSTTHFQITWLTHYPVCSQFHLWPNFKIFEKHKKSWKMISVRLVPLAIQGEKQQKVMLHNYALSCLMSYATTLRWRQVSSISS